MKKIKYKVGENSQRAPLWKPWGAFGCMWRILMFLILLFLLFLLLSMLKSCEHETPARRPRIEDIRNTDLPEDIIGETPNERSEDAYSDPNAPADDNEIPGNIEDPGPHLPPANDNRIPPIDSDDIVDDDNGTRKASTRLNVLLESDVNDDTFREFARQFKEAYPSDEYEILFYNTFTKLLQIGVPASECDRVKSELPNKITGISFRVFDETMFGNARVTPNDPGFNHDDINWYLAPIQAYEAWEITQGSPNVIVAIVDSYFDLSHDELEPSRIVSPYSIPLGSSDVRPSRDCPENNPAFLHGSAVASQAVGSINNASGLCGIAPKCKLMPISMGHQFTTMSMLQGILYAIYQGANVVNVSAGVVLNPDLQNMPIEEQIAIAQGLGRENEEIWQFVFDVAERRNVTIVWAAGNENYFSGLDHSKRGDNTIRVAAVDQTLERAYFSNYGNFAEYDCAESTISAPGTDILCAMPFNTYCSGGGTSYSAPIVTGAVALMKSIDPTLSNQRIIEILQASGKPLANSPEIGPLLQIKDALLMVQEQFVSFDDIMANHELLVGTWQTVTDLYRIDSEGIHMDEKMKNFYQIHDERNAEVKIYEYVTSMDVFSSRAKIRWATDRIYIDMLDNAKSSNSSRVYGKKTYTLERSSDGKVQCRHLISAGDTAVYMIKKISNNPNIDIKSYE